MNIPRLVEKFFVGLFLTATLIPLQSCSNTLIGEKLENSFDINDNPVNLKDATKVKEPLKGNEIKKIKLSKKLDEKSNENNRTNNTKNNLISNKERLSEKSKKKVIFKPQPYRIILKLSGANPSAPAETVTAALRKAGVEFEVEKIERFDEDSLLKNASLKR